MAATVTLSTTTLADGVDSKTTRIKLADTSGVLPGLRLYLDGEAMTVLRLEVDPWVSVTRGVDGSAALPHSGGVTVYIARGDQLYSGPPFGRPEAAIPVSPYIDVLNGKVYFAQGDASATAARWWQAETTTHGVGSLGIRTTTSEPTSST